MLRGLLLLLPLLLFPLAHLLLQPLVLGLQLLLLLQAELLRLGLVLLALQLHLLALAVFHALVHGFVQAAEGIIGRAFSLL